MRYNLDIPSEIFPFSFFSQDCVKQLAICQVIILCQVYRQPDNLNLEPNKAYPIQRWEINPEELFLYVRRESGKAWVIFIPRIEKNLLVFNRAFWKGAEVISQPEGDSGEKAKESG